MKIQVYNILILKCDLYTEDAQQHIINLSTAWGISLHYFSSGLPANILLWAKIHNPSFDNFAKCLLILALAAADSLGVGPINYVLLRVDQLKWMGP